jgi:hypothetical protein
MDSFSQELICEERAEEIGIFQLPSEAQAILAKALALRETW